MTPEMTLLPVLLPVSVSVALAVWLKVRPVPAKDMVAFEADPDASMVKFPSRVKFLSVEVALFPVYWSVPPANINLLALSLAAPKGPFTKLLVR